MPPAPVYKGARGEGAAGQGGGAPWGVLLPPGVGVVDLSLTVEWGVGMERQGPSYGEVVTQEMYEYRPFSEEVKALRLVARRRSSGL